MTFPVLQATARGVEVDVTTHDVVLPATVNAGDLLVARFVNRASATVTWDNSTAGAWTQLHSTTSSGLRFSVFWKIADGTEDGATLSVATSVATRSAWHIDRFSGAQSVEAGVAVAGNGNPNPPALDPSWGTEDVYWIVSLGWMVAGFDPTPPPPPPANYSGLIHDDSGGGTGGVEIWSAYRQLNAASDDPGQWVSNSQNRDFVVNTYAVRAGATLFPPRLDVGVTFFAPSIKQIVAPPRLNVGVQFFAPKVASLSILQAPRLNVGVTFFAPTVSSAILPPRLDVGVTFFPPTILKPGTLEPPRLNIGVQFFAPLVEGGFRVVPEFKSVSFGPFPGAIGDAVLLTGAPNETRRFEDRWAIRGPIGFTDFAPFVASMYEFDEAYVWLRLVLDTGAIPAIAITQALMHIDVPDTRDSGEAEIAIGGEWVDFVRTFNAPPDVVAQVITASAVTEAPKATVRDDIETGRFFVTCHTGDDTTNSVAARIKWIAQGF